MPQFKVPVTLVIDAADEKQAEEIATYMLECEIDVQHVLMDYIQSTGVLPEDLAAEIAKRSRTLAKGVVEPATVATARVIG